MKLSILISTYNERILDIGDILTILNDDRVEILIGHQCSDSFVYKDSFKQPNVSYYNLKSKGVTRSRNFLLGKAIGEIVYFCDDDIILDDNFVNTIVNSHIDNDSPVITFKINNEYNQPRKNYPMSGSYRSWFSILSVGTVEITFKRKFLGKICFPNDMGAGTSIPTGDEAVFLSNFLRKGFKIYHSGLLIASHPDESSGSNISHATTLSRGVTLRRVYGIFGIFLILPFFIQRRKVLFRPSGEYSALLVFIKGYFL